ncbi:MAG: hypothetical protein ACT4PL_13010 [Phycisphaerales bacterium]
MSKNRNGLLALSVVGMVAGASLAGDPVPMPVPGPINNTFDWFQCQRTILLNFNANVPAYMLYNGAGNKQGALTQAADIWNAAATGWTFRYAGDALGAIPAGLPVLDVRMGTIVPAGAVPAGEDFDLPTEMSSQGAPIDGDTDLIPPGGPPLNPPPSRTLAIFRRLAMPPNMQINMAEFIINPLRPNMAPFTGWDRADGFNPMNGLPVATFDPVIMSLHELGHALRLEHNGAGGTSIAVPNGPVMRPGLERGAHLLNPAVGIPYRLAAEDVLGAMNSAATCIPSPSAAGFLAMAGVLATRRRRAA